MTQPINVLEYEPLAKERLSQLAWDYYDSGAWGETTVRDNRAAFGRYRLLPRMLVDVHERNLRTTVVGFPLETPMLVAPMAFHCLAHLDGEVATAQAAAEAGVPFTLSTLATRTIEDVAAVRVEAPQWFQLYIHRDRELTRALVQRAEAAGYGALCLTVDAPILGVRERDQRNQFALPAGLHAANLVTLGDVDVPDDVGGSGLFAYFADQIDPSLTWGDLEWLRSITNLPILLKGILRPDDAQRAVEHGAHGIVVSNHGGRQLDGAVAPLDALRPIAETVGDRIDVLMDGGIRRGTDILIALALGAKAVLISRPVLWGLAVDGPAGARHVLDLLRTELDQAMALAGCAGVADIDASLVMRV